MLIQTLNHNHETFVDATELALSIKKNTIRALHVEVDISILEVSKQILMLENAFDIDKGLPFDEASEKLATRHYGVVRSDYEMPEKDRHVLIKKNAEGYSRSVAEEGELAKGAKFVSTVPQVNKIEKATKFLTKPEEA